MGDIIDIAPYLAARRGGCSLRDMVWSAVRELTIDIERSGVHPAGKAIIDEYIRCAFSFADGGSAEGVAKALSVAKEELSKEKLYYQESLNSASPQPRG